MQAHDDASDASDPWTTAKEQARLAAHSGGLACVVTSALAFFAPADIAAIGIDALRMTLALTAGVPPLVLLGGRLLTRRLRSRL